MRKSDYSDIAKSILNNYYSGYHDISYTIDGKFIAEVMGYQTHITDEHLSEEQKKKLKLYACEGFAEKNELEKKKTNSPLAEAINFHINRCGLTSEDVIERSGLGSTTISKLRTGQGSPKLETILAFCQALELEEHFRADLMKKARVEFDTTKDSHNMYLIILDLFPKANVFQINNFLIEQDYKPWTRERKVKNRKVV